MCLILFAYQACPGQRLVLAANRDEYYARPTQALHYWPDAPQVLAGKDLEAGGTWMGINHHGRFAAITNFRDPRAVKSHALSRGQLVREFLAGAQSVNAYSAQLLRTADQYNGFNLLFGDDENLYYFSSHAGQLRRLEPGIYGLSNDLLDTPWPKVVRGKSALEKVLSKNLSSPELSEALFEIMADRRQAEDAQLPDTGIGREWERLLSSMFIDAPGYGTRSSSVLILSDAGQGLFVEREFSPDAANKQNAGQLSSEAHYVLSLGATPTR